MARDDWYQNKHWNKRTAAIFFEELARARSGRDQFLVVQALCLAGNHPDVSLELVELFLETKSSDFDILKALSARAESLNSLGRQVEMIAKYKEILAFEAGHSNQQTLTRTEFPYIIACRNIKSEYGFALDLLALPLNDVTFPSIIFQKNVARAFIHQKLGDKTKSRAAAHIAVGQGFVRKSGLRYHQDIGLVGDIPQKILRRLMKIIK